MIAERIAGGFMLRPGLEADDPVAARSRGPALTAYARGGPNAATLFQCGTCPRTVRGDMLVSLGGKWICDGCWTAVRRQEGGISEAAARHDPAMPPPAEAGGSEQG